MTTEQINKIREDILECFSGINLNEETHIYSVKGNTEYESATTFLKGFYAPFNEYMMAELVARAYNKKNPVSLKRTGLWYRKYWKAKKDEASARGNRVHQYAESYPDCPNPACKQEEGVLNWYKDLDKNVYEILFMELRMYDTDIKKAGTADLILLNKKTGKLVIGDWKTNSVNLLQCYKSNKLKRPFENMLDNKLNKYKLQLSLYQVLIEKNTNYKVEDRWLIWLKDGEYKIVDSDKNSDNYIMEDVDADIVGDGYLQFNVESHSKHLFIELYEKDTTEKKSLFKKKPRKNKSTV